MMAGLAPSALKVPRERHRHGSPAASGAAFDRTPNRAGLPAILDLVHLTRQTFGDASLEHEVLTLFARQADSTTSALRQAGNDDERARLFHLLKGSARGVGALRLAAAAEAGESEPGSASLLDAVFSEAAAVGQHVRALLREMPR